MDHRDPWNGARCPPIHLEFLSDTNPPSCHFCPGRTSRSMRHRYPSDVGSLICSFLSLSLSDIPPPRQRAIVWQGAGIVHCADSNPRSHSFLREVDSAGGRARVDHEGPSFGPAHHPSLFPDNQSRVGDLLPVHDMKHSQMPATHACSQTLPLEAEVFDSCTKSLTVG